MPLVNSRRKFLLGLGAGLVAAPALVRRESLDLVRGFIVPSRELLVPGWVRVDSTHEFVVYWRLVKPPAEAMWEQLPPSPVAAAS